MDNEREMHQRRPTANENAKSAAFDGYRLEKVLCQRKSEFIDDFAYADIHRDMERGRILPSEKLNAIKKIRIDRERIEYLFFLLIYKASTAAFAEFSHILHEKYEWLADRIELDLRNLNRTDDTDEDYYEPIILLRKEIPKHVDYNVHRCKYLWDLRQNLLTLERHQYLVVLGSLSFGKQWLVMDACCSYEVMHRMRGKIFWVNCSKCKTPEKILQQLIKLAIRTIGHTMNTNYKDIQNKIVMLNETLRHVFEKNAVLQDCLIVLIDVQNHDTLKAFDLNCKVLITTRNKRLLEHLSRATMRVEVNSGFTHDECLELFSKMLDVPIVELPQEATDLHRICGANPFIISRIASNLKEYPWKRQWSVWKGRLENYESTQYDEFRKPIEQSLKAISDIKDLYRSLVIFTDNVKIPICVLEKYWNRQKFEVEEIVQRLDKLYLLECNMGEINDDEIYCSLHYHYYSYLTNLINSKEKQRMHAKLVESYHISEALHKRIEPNISDLPDDKYFHFYIGYHLKESAMVSLFPELYFDFGFIEQKLRFTGLPNTLGDFNSYKMEIAGTDAKRIELMDDLTDFLANIEEILIRTPDTCLLQYALTTDNAVQVEAMKQARKFTKRIWFTDIDHSVKYRQIVQLPEQPKLIRFVEPNSSLVAFANNTIQLTDMSSEYTVAPTVYSGHDCTIRDLQSFHENYFASLDEKGILKIWSLKDTEIQRRRRSRGTKDANIQVGARQKFPSTSSCARKTNPGQLLQTMDSNIRCFIVHHRNDSGEMEMFAATARGRILLCKWNDTKSIFEIRPSLSFDAHVESIEKLILIQGITEHQLMTINHNGVSDFFNLRDQSRTMRTTKITFPTVAPINVHTLPSDVVRNPTTVNGLHAVIAVVYFDRVYQITVSTVGQVLLNDMIEAYRITNEQNFITCSSITGDRRYLILGTRKGIIVFDPMLKREILRSSVSDNITCIDVCSLDDETYRYILISATKKGGAVINVHGIQIEDRVVAWATNRNGSLLNGARGTINAWLIGGKAFDAIREDDGNYTLVAADEATFVHCISSVDSFNASVELRSANSTITTVSIGMKKKYFGCESGAICEFSVEQPLSQLDESVEYLKYYEQFDLLIASTKNRKKILAPRMEFGYEGEPVLATFPYRDRFIILVNSDCSFDILNLSSKQINRITSEEIVQRVDCMANVDNLLVIGLKQIIHVFKITESLDNNSLEIKRVASIDTQARDEVKSMATTISNNRILIAVGYKSGTIELYDATEQKSIQVLQRLKCHKEPVHFMAFSPPPPPSPVLMENDNVSASIPIILASISEEICFWNVLHALSNPMDRGNQLRLSQRINRKTTSNRIDAQTIHTNGNVTNGNVPNQLAAKSFGNRLHVDHSFDENFNADNGDEINPWLYKTGPSEKPELLSCIKFVGSSAGKFYANREFNTFITVDNEGVIYFLKANNQLKDM